MYGGEVDKRAVLYDKQLFSGYSSVQHPFQEIDRYIERKIDRYIDLQIDRQIDRYNLYKAEIINVKVSQPEPETLQFILYSQHPSFHSSILSSFHSSILHPFILSFIHPPSFHPFVHPSFHPFIHPSSILSSFHYPSFHPFIHPFIYFLLFHLLQQFPLLSF